MFLPNQAGNICKVGGDINSGFYGSYDSRGCFCSWNKASQGCQDDSLQVTEEVDA